MTAAGKKIPLFLAPMAGVTNTIFRRICKEFGADVLTTEFVSAEGIFHRNARTREYLEFTEEERPLGVQLFGADPDHLAKAAQDVVEWVRPDFIDLNFGCPVNKVVCKNGGSALLRDCPLLEKVAASVVRAVAPLPVTAKIRIGWNARTINATTTARLLENCGITRLTVHGRTKEQGYSGLANWDVIAEVVQSVSIPVIGNGDICSGEDAAKKVAQSGVAGLMIGRAAMCNPWIFREVRATLENDPSYLPPTLKQRWNLILRHCREEITWRGSELHAMRSLRSRLMQYTRGMPGGRHLREKIATLSSLAELEAMAHDYLTEAMREDPAEFLPA